jgi:hypothetical protein
MALRMNRTHTFEDPKELTIFLEHKEYKTVAPTAEFYLFTMVTQAIIDQYTQASISPS